MKFIKTLIVLVMVGLSLCQCDALRSVTTNKVTSQGAPYELIVVSNQPEWESALGDSLRSLLNAPLEYSNEQEPRFTVLRVTQQAYQDLIAKHRNILEVNIQPSIDSTAVAVRYDVHAAPQIVLTLQAPTVEAAREYVAENGEYIAKAIEIAERDRAVEYAKKYSVKSLDNLIEEKFGVKMNIPQGYSLRQDSEDFLWLSYEFPVASQGVMIYSYPAEFGINSLTSELLLDARNRFAARIPGPSDGSYMTTFDEFEQVFTPLRIKGRLWCEQRGFWDVAGDYMGGPYVSYSTIDQATNRVFTIDCYVYSPKYSKRNYLHAVEHLVYGVEIEPTDDTPVTW